MAIVKRIFIALSILVFVYLGICLTLVFWPIPKKQHIENFDFSVLKKNEQQPTLGTERWLTLRDNKKLFYRYYDSNRYYDSKGTLDTNVKNTLILIHGSGSESRYLGNLATFLAENNISRVITPDLRGHGRTSNPKGDVNYIGQYEDDIEDIVNAVRATYPDSKIVLGGHSSGGGLVLRYAGNSTASPVDAYLFFSPYLGHEAPTVKPNSGEWVTVAIKRWIGLSMLNDVGIRVFNGLPVLLFNLPDALVDEFQTPSYSYRLAMSYQPNNYIEDIKKIDRPTLVVVGDKDEAFNADQFAPAFKPSEKFSEVKLIANATHLDVLSNQNAQEKIAEWYATKLH